MQKPKVIDLRRATDEQARALVVWATPTPRGLNRILLNPRVSARTKEMACKRWVLHIHCCIPAKTRPVFSTKHGHA